MATAIASITTVTVKGVKSHQIDGFAEPAGTGCDGPVDPRTANTKEVEPPALTA